MKLATPTAILLITLFCSKTFSQTTTTFDISGGYCFPLAQSTEAVVLSQAQSTTPPHYYTTYASLKRMSYGQGGCLAVNLNWFSKKNIGFGVKLNLLFGSAFKHSTTLATATTGTEYYTFSDKSFSFQFIPHICFRHDFKKVSPVLEAGMIVGMVQINQNYTITSTFYNEQIQTKVRDYGGVMLGFYSSLGLCFNVSEVVKISLALNCIAGSYSPTKWERTSFFVDGFNKMDALSISQLKGEYVKELDLQASQSSQQPRQSLKYSAAMSNIGITAGICFKLNKRNKKTVKSNSLDMPPPSDKNF